MLPDLLRDCDTGLALVRRTSTHLEVVDANRTAARLLGCGGQDLRGPVGSATGVGRLSRLAETVDRALGGEKSQWHCELDLDDGKSVGHLNVNVSPFDGVPARLALIQLSALANQAQSRTTAGAVQ